MKTFLRLLTRPAVASAIVALALTALLYRDALTLPLFSDDLVQIPWLASISWRQLWTSPSPYGYYRPLWYTLWRLWGALTGGLRPPGLHFLNVAAHCVAAWLAGLLAAAWTRSDPAGQSVGESRLSVACMATALFAAFPFSCQAVAWPGALYNPLVSAMAAGALLAYDRGRQGKIPPSLTGRGKERVDPTLPLPLPGREGRMPPLPGRVERMPPLPPRERVGVRVDGAPWITLAFLLAVLAPFTYEAGLLVSPLIVLAEGLGWLQRRWARRSWWPLAFAGLFPLTLGLWRAMRGTGITHFGLNLLDLRRNAAYLVQGLTYPTAPLAQRLVAWQGLDPELSLWLIAIPTLALLAWYGWRWNRGVLWLGAAWCTLFSLPPLISMEADWFALAPRFLYMTAAGACMLWVAAAAAWLKPLHSPWRALAAGALLVVLLAPSCLFVRDGMRWYRMVGQPIWEAADAARQARPLLLVNLPMQIEPHRRTYPLGFEGVVPLPARVAAEGLIYVHTGVRDGAQAVAFGIAAVDQPPGYTYRLFGQPAGWEELANAARQARAVYLTRYEPERIHLVEAGEIATGTVPSGEPLARFQRRAEPDSSSIALLRAGYTCSQDGLFPPPSQGGAGGGWSLRLTTYWQVAAPVETDVTIFAHLLTPEHTLIAQTDGYPLLGMFPFWLWKPGETVRDVRHFDPMPAGEYVLRLGLWELATGEHWPAAGAYPEPVEGYTDGVVLLPVRCP